MLYQAPEKYDRLVGTDDEQASLRDRARAYLQVNCAGCHLTNGGGNARINLDYKLNDNLINLINAKPLHATYGISNPSLIAPGAPPRPRTTAGRSRSAGRCREALECSRSPDPPAGP